MKTVFDRFSEYACKALDTSRDTLPSGILQGIRDYLTELDLNTAEDEDGRLSQVELARFRLMPPSTLSAFFEFFSVRSQIEVIEKESELLALNRIQTGKTIREDTYRQKINAFYSASTSLAADERYSVWLSRTEKNIMLNLKYALGVSNEISVALHEKIEMFGER